MAVQQYVGSHLVEGLGLVVAQRVLSAVHDAGLQGGVQLAVGDDGRLSAEGLDHADHGGVGGDADLQALQVVQAGDGLVAEDVAEAFLADEQAVQAETFLIQLVHELLGQIAAREIPEVVAAGEGEGQAEQLGLRNAVLAIAGQRGDGQAGHVDGPDAADHVVAKVAFRAEDAGALNVDRHGAAGQLVDSLGKVQRHLADDGVVQIVHFGVNQGHGRITGSIRHFVRHGKLAEEQSDHYDRKNKTELFHWESSLTIFCIWGLTPDTGLSVFFHMSGRFVKGF